MPTITLPDGSRRTFPSALSGYDIAASIGSGLAKAALALKIDGKLRDLDTLVDKDCSVEIVTASHADALELLRHDCAHVLAEAVQELYPGTQITFGPATENGFYYDFHRNAPFSTEDFPEIENKMREIVARNEKITREIWSRDQIEAYFRDHGERFKAEWVREIPASEEISVYRQGNWLDMCTGPHLPSTGKLGKAFKLLKVSGTYWRGDPNNPQLQRIYGTCWANEKQLEDYLHQLEEAEKRDHRRIGREMDLFHQQEEAQGAVFWHPKGWTLYRIVENYVRAKIARNGYQEVKTPQLLDRAFWEQSGHWDKYRENMFLVDTEDKKTLALKPMNCPGHVQIFKQGIKSYRDLPIRLAEFGACHRYEPSGALHGIMRVRAFTQDDAHIFCREDQIAEESLKFCRLLEEIYRDFGFTHIEVLFASRPTISAGTAEVWDRAESTLRRAMEAAGFAYKLNAGEGTFYGPKLEFCLKDTIGRSWQCGTLQLDYILPERLDASYIGEDGAKHRPVMLHRAILGSLERFLGILIENYAGKFPLWLAPVQAVVCSVVSESNAYADDIADRLRAAGLRVETDPRNEKIGYKVREHSLAKVPAIIAVGPRDRQAGTVALRRLGEEGQRTMPLAEAVGLLAEEAMSPLEREAKRDMSRQPAEYASLT
ncbi:MAG TPA: threonine--tRNA ligase [Dongiaceae bacterium]|jgi:threonyl-tRNA synthetase|nr:threonine--tRNA ligase [Dongiaceae bacterium]